MIDFNMFEMSAEDKALRAQGIGGSEAAAACGVSQYADRTPLQLYREKVEGIEREFDLYKKFKFAKGHLAEQLVRIELEEKKGLKFLTRSEMPNNGNLIHPKFPWMRCFLDLLSSDYTYVGEAKYTDHLNRNNWGAEGTDDMPEDYIVQCAHNRIVAEAALGVEIPEFHLHLIGNRFGKDEHFYYIYRKNEDLESKIIAREGAFMKLVEAKTPPTPQNDQDIKTLYPESKDVPIEATPEIFSALEQYQLIKDDIETRQAQLEAVAVQIKDFMGDADTLVDAAGTKLVTYKSSKPRETLDTKALKQDMPEVYERFKKVSAVGARPFKVL